MKTMYTPGITRKEYFERKVILEERYTDEDIKELNYGYRTIEEVNNFPTELEIKIKEYAQAEVTRIGHITEDYSNGLEYATYYVCKNITEDFSLRDMDKYPEAKKGYIIWLVDMVCMNTDDEDLNGEIDSFTDKYLNGTKS